MQTLKVLIPLDGSRLAEAPLAYLSSLRALGELHPVLFSVVPDLEQAHGLNIEESVARERNLLTAYLRETATGIEKHLGLVCETRVAFGRPAEQILQAAAEVQPDLVVISTHGRSGPSRWRVGSVADKVIRGVSCNVLVLGPKAAKTAEWFAELRDPFRNILLPLDGSPLAGQAIPVAAAVAERFGSTLHLVQVISIPVYGDASGEAIYPELVESMENAARSYLQETRARLELRSKTVTKILYGPPSAELRAYSDQHKVDLVVMTSHGRGGVSRAAFGSVTDRLLGCDAPVLVVKPQLTEAGERQKEVAHGYQAK